MEISINVLSPSLSGKRIRTKSYLLLNLLKIWMWHHHLIVWETNKKKNRVKRKEFERRKTNQNTLPPPAISSNTNSLTCFVFELLSSGFFNRSDGVVVVLLSLLPRLQWVRVHAFSPFCPTKIWISSSLRSSNTDIANAPRDDPKPREPRPPPAPFAIILWPRAHQPKMS